MGRRGNKNSKLVIDALARAQLQSEDLGVDMDVSNYPDKKTYREVQRRKRKLKAQRELENTPPEILEERRARKKQIAMETGKTTLQVAADVIQKDGGKIMEAVASGDKAQIAKAVGKAVAIRTAEQGAKKLSSVSGDTGIDKAIKTVIDVQTNNVVDTQLDDEEVNIQFKRPKALQVNEVVVDTPQTDEIIKIDAFGGSESEK